MNSVDPRVARSQEYIDAAFVALLHRRAYVAIRVGDIARKAGVGRATFYAHYATKDALLASQLQRIVAPLIKPGADGPDCTALFAHIASAPGIYRGLMAGGSAPLVARLFRECFEARLAVLHPFARHDDAGVPIALRLRACASILLAQIEWWLEQTETHAPEAMQCFLAAMLRGWESDAGRFATR